MSIPTAKNRTYNIIAICCGLWFILSGSIWVYLANVFISFPFALLGFFLWYHARKNGSTDNWNRAALILLSIGAVMSVVTLVVLLVTN
jgi:hypothetical protein